MVVTESRQQRRARKRAAKAKAAKRQPTQPENRAITEDIKARILKDAGQQPPSFQYSQPKYEHDRAAVVAHERPEVTLPISPHRVRPRRSARELIFSIAHVRVNTHGLAEDLDRALKRANVDDREIKRLRRLAGGIAFSLDRIHRRSDVVWGLPHASAYARDLADYLPVFRNPAPY